MWPCISKPKRVVHLHRATRHMRKRHLRRTLQTQQMIHLTNMKRILISAQPKCTLGKGIPSFKTGRPTQLWETSRERSRHLLYKVLSLQQSTRPRKMTSKMCWSRFTAILRSLYTFYQCIRIYWGYKLINSLVLRDIYTLSASVEVPKIWPCL